MVEEVCGMVFNHGGKTVSESLGLTEEEYEEITKAVGEVVARSGTKSEVVEALVRRYCGDIRKLVAAVFFAGGAIGLAECLQTRPPGVLIVNVGGEDDE